MTFPIGTLSPLDSVCADQAVCPAQILVIDRPNGPAHVLIDTLSQLGLHEISLTLVTDPTDALRALDYFAFDVVVVGVDGGQMAQLAVLPPTHALRPEVPVLVVGRSLPAVFEQYARRCGASQVISLPQRAADLRRLVVWLINEVLPTWA